MSIYMSFVGAMNVMGALLLLGALSETFADGLLRRWTYIIPPDEPYVHSRYGRLWLWWAAIGTGFFGVLNLVAAHWPEAYARVVLYGDIYAYLSFEALAIAGSLSGRYGRGMAVAHCLWLGQGGWGVAVALG
jgi:hypothetical protein